MKLKKYFIILLSLLYFDLIFNLFSFDSYLRESFVNIILFCFVNSFFIFIFTSIWSDKVNRIVTYILYSFMGIWYSLYFVFYKVLLTPFSLLLLRQTDQVLDFPINIILSILQNIHVILLNFVPLILFVIFRKKINSTKLVFREICGYVLCLCLAILVYVGNIFIGDRSTGSIYNLYFETNNVSLNIERLGVMASTLIDVERALFGFDEKLLDVSIDTEEEDNSIFNYDYNVMDLDLSSSSGDIGVINNYVSMDSGTKKNEYTGIFDGMNLIFVIAESFSEIAVSEELTPTLYKLVNNGFVFENYYTSNNLSTIGGEFQALTGLYADNSILSSWRSGSNYFPYGLGNMFKNSGYNVHAYHNNSAYFQDRNVYLKTQGFDNFKGCYNGLENLINCEQWPQSDVEMINATIDDYLNSDELFMTYYMTVSGHFYYNFSGNSIAKKNKSYVEDLEYNENVQAYLATQIELDKALELLISKLDEAGKLDNTVIVLTADHFPYNLDIDDINSLSDYKRDVLIEANSNNLIIYNSKMKRVNIEKTAMSIDVLPTVLNLFGMEYDSRIIMGRDILSSTMGIAIFKDKSWITDMGTYYASSGKFVSDMDVSDDYVDNVNNIVNNRVAISRMIVDSDFYRKIFNK